MSITYYQSNKILDKEFGSVDYTPAGTLYFGLSTTTPTANGGSITEPSGGAYARVAVANSSKSPNWNSASNGSLTNAATITFVESTAGWGTITHVVIFDALTSGNALYFGALSPSRTVEINTVVYFATGAVTISIVNS